MTALRLSTLLSFVAERVVLLFLPAVAEAATRLLRTALIILRDEKARFPVWAQLVTVVEDVGFAAEILPVMSVDALGLVMFFVVGTPLGLEVVEVEV